MAATATDRGAVPENLAEDLAGLLTFVDTVSGLLPAMFFDWTRPREIALGVNFLLSFPVYLFDRRSKLRAVAFMLALVLTRLLLFACSGPGRCAFPVTWTPRGVLDATWGNRLLVAACVLLQWSKARRRSRVAVRADG